MKQKIPKIFLTKFFPGKIDSMNFDEGKFQLIFHSFPDSSVPTEIYLNQELWYPNGFSVKISPENSLVWNQVEENYLEFWNKNSVQELITIDITPL